jgi:3-oxoacyl-[acyl-carrier-protein] synthase-3
MTSYVSSRAVIEAVATSAESGTGSRALAVRAARDALGAAGRDPGEVEILVNAGVYRDENIIEPAMGPFIQRGIGANCTFPPANGTRTFSFDLANGACGPLTAIRVIDGFMRSGAVRSGLVVASDADPDPSRSENYPFAPTGGAILLRAADNGEGFAWFHARTWSEHFSLYEARLSGTEGLAPESQAWRAREQRLRFVERGDFAERAADCVGRTIEEAARDGRLDPAVIDLVVAAPGVAAFRDALEVRLRRAGVEAPVPATAATGAHTASTAFALAAARADGSWEGSRRILFVAAGAGITVSLALYQR